MKFIGIGNSSSSNWTSIANVNIYGDLNCENAATSIVNPQQEDLGITLFPVPVRDGILSILSTAKTLGAIEIYNVAGQQVLSTDGHGSYSKQIDVSTLPTGIYYIKLDEIGQTTFIIK